MWPRNDLRKIGSMAEIGMIKLETVERGMGLVVAELLNDIS